jgi:hypothetical protein
MVTSCDRLIAVDQSGNEHTVLILSYAEAVYPDREYLTEVIQEYVNKTNITIESWEILYYGQLTRREARELSAGGCIIKAG